LLSLLDGQSVSLVSPDQNRLFEFVVGFFPSVQQFAFESSPDHAEFEPERAHLSSSASGW
jgi:hypothetical protein